MHGSHLPAGLSQNCLLRDHKGIVGYPHSIHIPRASAISSPRSLKYEYELYVEREIEDYKDSVSRSALLKIGDEAGESLRKADQMGLTGILVWQAVERIIALRLRSPTHTTGHRLVLGVSAG